MADNTLETLWYLADYADEIMPCAPSLEAWAQWLSEPDPTWNRHQGAEPGEVFLAVRMVRHANSTARLVEGDVVLDPPAPQSANFFAEVEGGGWDPDSCVNQASHLEGLLEDGETVVAVCTEDPATYRLRFDIDGDGPFLTNEGPVQ